MLGPETTLLMVRKILQPMTSVYWVFLKVNTWNRTTHGKGKRMEKPEPEKGVFSCMCSVLFEVTWALAKMWLGNLFGKTNLEISW